MNLKSIIFAVGTVLMTALSPAFAASIYVIDSDAHPRVTDAKNYLSNVGHAVSAGGALGDYSAYDQVWDLRYNTAISGADTAAMAAFLQGGGRMYLTGEHAGFGARNASVVAHVSAVGAGALSLNGAFFNGNQRITAAGQAVNSPNNFASVNYQAAETSSTAGSGFLVTEDGNSGMGSLVGWNFGDIAGAANARMLIGFDIEIFNNVNGQGWTENMAAYLGENNVPNIPLPAGLPLLLAGVGVFGILKRRSTRA